MRLEEPVGFTFVYPPFAPTYTTSPSEKADVSTPFKNPVTTANPSASSAKSSFNTKVAGIVDATEAEAAIISDRLPTELEA